MTRCVQKAAVRSKSIPESFLPSAEERYARGRSTVKKRVVGIHGDSAHVGGEKRVVIGIVGLEALKDEDEESEEDRSKRHTWVGWVYIVSHMVEDMGTRVEKMA